jgi:Spy/CpxP family protein refolding chaperone
MVGFLFGAVVAVVAVKYWGMHFGHRERGSWGGGRGGGWGRRWILRGLYERLQTTPGQERVIEAAVDQVADAASRFRDERHRFRADVAASVKGDRFDSTPLNEMFSRQDAVIAQLRKVLTEGLAKVHETLDPKQRGALGEALQYGPGWGGGCGHHRHFGGHGRHGYEGRMGAV